MILGPLGDNFGTILELFWNNLWNILEPFETTLGPFWEHFKAIDILTYFDLFGPMGTYCYLWGPILKHN